MARTRQATRTCVATLVLVLVVGRAAAEPEFKGTPGQLRGYFDRTSHHVTLSADAEIRVQADHGIADFSLATKKPTLREALEANHRVRDQIVQFVVSHGLEPERVRTSRFSSTSQMGLFGKKPNSYEVRNIVSVTVKNDREFLVVAELPEKFREVQYAGIRFEHSRRDELELQAVSKACENAQRKQRAYEQVLGVKLAIVTFLEESSKTRWYTVRGLPAAEEYARKSAVSRMAKRSSEAMRMPQFGELQVTANIAVKYKLVHEAAP